MNGIKLVLILAMVILVVLFLLNVFRNEYYNTMFGEETFIESNSEVIKNKLLEGGSVFQFTKPVNINYEIVNSSNQFYRLNPKRTKDDVVFDFSDRFIWIDLSVFYTQGDMLKINKYYSDKFYERYDYVGNEKFGNNYFRVYHYKNYPTGKQGGALYVTKFGDYHIVIEKDNTDSNYEITGFEDEFHLFMASVDISEYRNEYASDIEKFINDEPVIITSDYVEKYGTSIEARDCYNKKLLSERGRCLEEL